MLHAYEGQAGEKECHRWLSTVTHCLASNTTTACPPAHLAVCSSGGLAS